MVLPLTSTDMVGEVVTSSMSCARSFLLDSPSAFLTLRVFYAFAFLSLSQYLPMFARSNVCFFLYRKDDLPWTGIESPPEVQTRLSTRPSAFISARYVRACPTNNDGCCCPVHSSPRTNRSAFLILVYRKSHGAWDMLQ